MTDNDNDAAWESGDEDDTELEGESEISADGEVSHAAAGSEPIAEGDRQRKRRKAEDDYVSTDERAKVALKFVSDLIREMEMECTVHLRRPQEGNAEDEINIEIAGRDAGRIIGKKGQVLQALQFLTHRIINRPGLDRRHILVDAEGYRSRRDNSLATMAQRLGRQAVDEGKIITFEPMNPRDRRVVHLALAKFEGVITRSDGEGDDRRVQIIPVRRSTGAAGGTVAPN
jgi:spoIIIJ-associated protein